MQINHSLLKAIWEWEYPLSWRSHQRSKWIYLAKRNHRILIWFKYVPQVTEQMISEVGLGLYEIALMLLRVKPPLRSRHNDILQTPGNCGNHMAIKPTSSSKLSLKFAGFCPPLNTSAIFPIIKKGFNAKPFQQIPISHTPLLLPLWNYSDIDVGSPLITTLFIPPRMFFQILPYLQAISVTLRRC